jgi:hypothetical protein
MRYAPNTGFPPGTIVLAAPMQPRFYEFQMSMEQVMVPDGTQWAVRRGCDITNNFNSGIAQMVGEWVWFMGDDHAFAPDTLLKLLAHNVDVVVPISACKAHPFVPCVVHKPEDGSVWSRSMTFYNWSEVSGHGLLKLPSGDFIGQAGMLVRKHVLDKIGSPWFKTGMFDRGKLQEDMWFCHELQTLGYDVWVDQDIILEHWGIVGITAVRQDGQYAPSFITGSIPDKEPSHAA